MEDGVSEVWESVAFMNSFRSKLLKANKQGTDLYDRYVEKQYKDGTNKLRKYWDKDLTDQPSVLEEVLKISKPTMFGFFIMF